MAKQKELIKQGNVMRPSIEHGFTVELSDHLLLIKKGKYGKWLTAYTDNGYELVESKRDYGFGDIRRVRCLQPVGVNGQAIVLWECRYEVGRDHYMQSANTLVKFLNNCEFERTEVGQKLNKRLLKELQFTKES